MYYFILIGFLCMYIGENVIKKEYFLKWKYRNMNKVWKIFFDIDECMFKKNWYVVFREFFYLCWLWLFLVFIRKLLYLYGKKIVLVVK